MKILILSLEAWRDDTNGGNVLSNIFNGIDAELAQIYCSAEKPKNTLCKHYFQITDAMALDNIRHRKEMGREFFYDDQENCSELEWDEKIRNIKKKKSSWFLRLARQAVWGLSKYKNKKLQKFIEDFNPDIIFAPCYASTYMLSLCRYIHKLTKKPIISYVSDDVYSLKHCNFSPIFWLNKFIVRHAVKKTWKLYSLVYTMSSIQKEYMERLKKPMKILCKSSSFDDFDKEKQIGTPITIIYAGGTYENRWRTLCALTKEIKKINRDGCKIILNIYTKCALNKKAERILNDQENAFVYPAIDYEELMKKYREYDIALHAESFRLKDRLNVRMSFSTKIIDCLASGCAVMAICDKKQGGGRYLNEQDAAICIQSLKKIRPTLNAIINDKNILQTYRYKAFACGEKNHQQRVITAGIKEDFKKILNNEELTL